MKAGLCLCHHSRSETAPALLVLTPRLTATPQQASDRGDGSNHSGTLFGGPSMSHTMANGQLQQASSQVWRVKQCSHCFTLTSCPAHGAIL